MTQNRISLTIALLAATLALPNIATAQCTPYGLGLFFADLKLNPNAHANTTFFPPPAAPGPHVILVGGMLTPNTTDPSCTGWYEALLKVKIPNGCTEANIWVEYEGMPTGWTINVGDSPTNNGFGGNNGGPENDAELQILDETLSVYSKGLGSGIVDLAQAHLGLTDGALEIVVRDQYVGWGQPFSSIDTANSGLLFALPDAGAAAGEENTFFLGVNRVVSLFGVGAGRTGCGVRRVMVTFR